MKDDLLIKHIRAGDEDAAEELVRRYYPGIMRFCRWQCGDIDLAEDLTQDTFYKALRCLDQYRKGEHFKAWLYSVAKSVCMDELRKHKPETDPDYDIYEIEDRNAGIQQIENEEAIKQMLSVLPGDQKEALTLRYMEGLSYREIGEVLGIPARTAQSRVNLALKLLRVKGEK